MEKIRHVRPVATLTAVMAFDAAGFLLLAFSQGGFRISALVVAVLLIAMMLVEYFVMLWLSPHCDRLMLIIVNFLAAIGMMLQYRMNPENALHQLIMFGAGIVAMFTVTIAMRRPKLLSMMGTIMALASLGILGALLFLGHESGGAKNWISIGGTLFQPSEFVKVALVFILADAMTDRTRPKELWASILFAVAAVGLLVLQKDLGAAMLIAGTFLIVFFVATGNLGATLIGLITGGAGAYASYLIFDHVRSRLAIWLDPWATYSTSGYQIAQGLMAIASGGLLGMGLGQGSPKLIPAYHTDYIFAVVCEEFGIIFGIGMIALYVLLIVRGALIALSAYDRFSALSAFGATALIGLQTFIIIGGVIKLIPLTGITLPFVSYGGSSIIACMALVGILEGTAARTGELLEAELAEDGP